MNWNHRRRRQKVLLWDRQHDRILRMEAFRSQRQRLEEYPSRLHRIDRRQFGIRRTKVVRSFVGLLERGLGEDGDFPKLPSVGNPEKSKSLELTTEPKPSMKRGSLDSSQFMTQNSTPVLTAPLNLSNSGESQGNPHPPKPSETHRSNNHTDKPMGFRAAVLGTSSKDPDPPEDLDPILSVHQIQDLNLQLSLSCQDVSSVPVLSSPFENNPTMSLQLLEACSRRSMPQPADADYRIELANSQRSIYQHLPVTFPRHRLPQLEEPDFYQHLDPDTLFYAFYFLPGDVAQYCAAKELKRQAWRYHTEHRSWFLRSGQPKVSTKDYEEGGYFYFEKSLSGNSLTGETEGYTNGWCSRKKDNFIFRYDQLEDELH